ncbi:MAG: DNA repair protein RecN [Magnetococcales bacterium]|nr:DNA repair protein RecN [Magnetococcales bacterium]
MLIHLLVENIALAQRVEIDFASGFTVISGETGAGKSVLLDALGLAMGQRADQTLLRAGCSRASVTAFFILPTDHPVLRQLEERDLSNPEAPSELFLRRVMSQKGRSRAYINDTPVSVGFLAEIGALLVEIHGQHDTTALLEPRHHRTILDAFADQSGKHTPLLDAVTDRYRQWKTLHDHVTSLKNQARDRADKIAYLDYQLEEMASLDPQSGEPETLLSELQRLSHVSQLQRSMDKCLTLLAESSNSSASETTGRSASLLEDGMELDPELASLAESVRSLHYEIDDIVSRLRSYRHHLELNPQRLQELEERIDTYHRLARKHRCLPSELATLHQQWHEERRRLDTLDADTLSLEEARKQAETEWASTAQALSLSRKDAGTGLAKGVEKALKELYMPKTRLVVRIKQRSDTTPSPHGNDEILFLISTNPGDPLTPMDKTASGGELSRILLAMKGLLAESMPATTLIHDEADTGVGGRVATAIGQKLKRAARTRQVLAITHLPQVAACADQHLLVEKHSSDINTRTSISHLNEQERTEEVARMLAGHETTESARTNARELMELSRSLSDGS